uniref:Uncharacterized protein n=1 Tax=Anguilla anguilla TaxID=7936 RepID=A0A0E9WWB2_ANGAN
MFIMCVQKKRFYIDSYTRKGRGKLTDTFDTGSHVGAACHSMYSISLFQKTETNSIFPVKNEQ